MSQILDTQELVANFMQDGAERVYVLRTNERGDYYRAHEQSGAEVTIHWSQYLACAQGFSNEQIAEVVKQFLNLHGFEASVLHVAKGRLIGEIVERTIYNPSKSKDPRKVAIPPTPEQTFEQRVAPLLKSIRVPRYSNRPVDSEIEVPTETPEQLFDAALTSLGHKPLAKPSQIESKNDLNDLTLQQSLPEKKSFWNKLKSKKASA